ncbi:hypothetical protein WR25_09763 [Diploscapter pachys]|uniref:Translation elongation factor EF1B beta/delta subunit guanine nucleotide exchange domain-containing protein n=1 Tax=Diploscapter pachys TaxID=2018661 RepID=A0A2A2K3B3_9BILA|nr:hypothetical protein WR25_09763 [Diploscapter pachys]
MTTVEALAHEALPTLESNLAIRSAGQNELGTHTVYTHVATTSTCSDQCEEGGKKRRGSKAGDAVQSVIDNAKKLITNVMGGHNDGSHHKNNSHNSDDELRNQVANLQEENSTIKREVSELRKMVENLQLTIKNLQGSGSASAAKSAPAPAKEESKEDEDFDLFGSEDEEDDEKKKIVEERLKAYAEKKAKKPGPIAKSSVILDVKPWDDETNMKEMEDLVRSIEMDGLVWGGGKLIAIGYGISKLQIICVIEDEKVSVDDLIERITTDFESHVQSVDIAAFNKI